MYLPCNIGASKQTRPRSKTPTARGEPKRAMAVIRAPRVCACANKAAPIRFQVKSITSAVRTYGKLKLCCQPGSSIYGTAKRISDTPENKAILKSACLKTKCGVGAGKEATTCGATDDIGATQDGSREASTPQDEKRESKEQANSEASPETSGVATSLISVSTLLFSSGTCPQAYD